MHAARKRTLYVVECAGPFKMASIRRGSSMKGAPSDDDDDDVAVNDHAVHLSYLGSCEHSISAADS